MKKFTLLSLLLTCSLILEASSKPKLTVEKYDQARDLQDIQRIIQQSDHNVTGLNLDGIVKDKAYINERVNGVNGIREITNNDRDQLLAKFLLLRDPETYVLKSERQFIGFITVLSNTIPNNAISNFTNLSITQFAIDQNHQRKGYGTLLLDTIMKIEKYNNVDIITLGSKEKNHRANEFYKAVGFKQVEPASALGGVLFRKTINQKKMNFLLFLAEMSHP